MLSAFIRAEAVMDSDEDIEGDDGMRMMIRSRKMMAGIMRRVEGGMEEKTGGEDEEKKEAVHERTVSDVTKGSWYRKEEIHPSASRCLFSHKLTRRRRTHPWTAPLTVFSQLVSVQFFCPRLLGMTVCLSANVKQIHNNRQTLLSWRQGGKKMTVTLTL